YLDRQGQLVECDVMAANVSPPALSRGIGKVAADHVQGALLAGSGDKDDLVKEAVVDTRDRLSRFLSVLHHVLGRTEGALADAAAPVLVGVWANHVGPDVHGLRGQGDHLVGAVPHDLLIAGMERAQLVRAELDYAPAVPDDNIVESVRFSRC